MKIKCKNCEEETRIRSQYVVNNKTVCPECKQMITTDGDLINIDAFIDLPVDERSALARIIEFRNSKPSQFESMERFENEIEEYIDGLFEFFPSIDLKSIGLSLTNYLIENHKDLDRDEIKMFKRCIAIIFSVVRMQNGFEKLDKMPTSELIKLVERGRQI